MPRSQGHRPSREEIRRFIVDSPGRVGKREIARAFGVAPDDKSALRALLAELRNEGAVAPAGHKRFTAPGRVPEATVVRVVGVDADGDALARPVDWPGDGPPPTVFMRPERRTEPALVPGDLVLAQLRPIGTGKFDGRTLRRLGDAPGRLVGLFRPNTGGGGRIEPADRRVKAEWRVPPGETAGAAAGELVVANPLPHGGAGLRPARIVERLGPATDANAVSLLVVATLGIPHAFPPDALAEAERAGPADLTGRDDLRALPLVTIDGADARDFDDAIWAEPDAEGYRLVVAIADVAHYVAAGSALDREARARGNSVYFPDRVIPMLPETLSNLWCSLRPGEDRACLFAELHIDRTGRKTAHRFGRGLMRSAARLTYHAVQTAHQAGDTLGLGDALANLYGAFHLLLAARRERGTLDLDLPEREITLDGGRVVAIKRRVRHDSHRLVEEFMILANVAAAEELEARHRPCVYRVHAPPSDDKLDGLRTILHGMGLGLPAGNQIHPRDLERVLQRVAETDDAALVNEVILRAQSQAEYAVANIGHFGLALTRYAHFTSPIRRYADLLVHRALLDQLDPEQAPELADRAAHITRTERRAAEAERDAGSRYVAAFLASQVGANFAARVTGVQRLGIFVTLIQNGASGLVSTRGLPDDFWVYDAVAQTLSGQRSRMSFRLAQEIEVRLVEANPLTGSLSFELPASARTGPSDRRA